jgi:hypothetical protein
MSECELIVDCTLFTDKMANLPKTTKIIKEKYCQSNFSVCARHMVFLALGKEKIPPDLFPGQVPKAKTLISKV